MIGVVSHGVSSGVQVVIGVDTHQDEHVAVAIDQQGIRLGERRLPATYPRLRRSRAMGPVPGRDQRIPGSKERVPTAQD